MNQTITIKIDLSKKFIRVLERLTGIDLQDPAAEFGAELSRAAADISIQVEKWQAAHIVPAEKERVLASDLYASFCRWCVDYDVVVPSTKLFGAELSRRGYSRRKVGGVVWYYEVALKEA